MPDKRGKKQDTRFKPGRSGNPNGRPEGSRSKTTLAMEALLKGEAEKLTRKAIEKALEGDMVAMRLCMDRLFPPRKGSPISINLPKVETIADVLAAQGVVIGAVADGELTPDEGQTMATILEAKRKAIETEELERRIATLEQKG